MNEETTRQLRQGQAEAWDRDLAAILIERGLLTAEEAHELRRGCEKGAFDELLIRTGRLTESQLADLHLEIEKRESLGSSALPDEVREAAENTLMRVGGYIRVEVIGRGGMGEVWKAWESQLGRWVALKFLEGTDPQLTKRFFREAQIASRLAHPGITRVHDVFSVPKGTYLALEFVDGGSLEGARRERRRAAEIARDAARAIQYAHVQGILHRDIKPANLLEAKDGRILVTDFGLARPIAPGGTLTLDGAGLGTPSFMAPEQALGKPADPRTDVYGIGATLFALVEGRLPVTGQDAADILRRVIHGIVPALTVRDELSVIIRKAMEHERGDRYPTAAELADDLDRYLAGEPIRARPVGALRRGVRRVRRHPFLSASVLLLFAALAGGTYFGMRWLSSRRARDRQAKADAEIEKDRKLAEERRPWIDEGRAIM